MKAGVRHVLTSFLYLEKRNDMKIVKRRKKNNPEIGFFIDSGAHSFQKNKFTLFRNWSLQDYEDYVKRYCAWLVKYRDYIDAAAELDIDYNVGLPTVERWQKNYFLPLEEKYGIAICYVWHEAYRLEGWDEMCAKHAYTGLPGEFSDNADFNKFIAIARRYSTKVHGFAATKQKDFRDVPWFSIDSITWKTCEMYGTLIDWDDNKQHLKFEQDKAKRVKYKAKFIRYGFHADNIIQDKDYKELTRYALWSMRRMEAFYEKRYTDRTFYYELRLPFPAIIQTWTNQKVVDTWEKFTPEKNFEVHKDEKKPSEIRKFLRAIAAVQNNVVYMLEKDKDTRDFLEAYFSSLLSPVLADSAIFQKELSQKAAPAAPPALERVDYEHFVEDSNPPKIRDESERDFSLPDLEFDTDSYPVPLKELVW